MPELLTGPLRFFLFLPVAIINILIILLRLFLLPFLPLWHWVKSHVISKVTWLQAYALLEICFEDWVGGTGCLRCDEFFSLATELPLTFSFLLPSVSLGRQTACAWHWATTGSQDTLQRILYSFSLQFFLYRLYSFRNLQNSHRSRSMFFTQPLGKKRTDYMDLLPWKGPSDISRTSEEFFANTLQPACNLALS